MQTLSYFDEATPDTVLRTLFAKYDNQGCGEIAVPQINQLLQHDLGLDNEQTEAFTLLMDKDGSRKISFDEFREWVKGGNRLMDDKGKYAKLKEAVDLFKRFDKDRSGNLDSQEFETFMAATGRTKELTKRGLAELDRDGNGQISFYEFLNWLKWLPEDIE